MEETKHVLTSKTQIAAMISTGLILYGLYAKNTGAPSINISEVEILAIAGVLCNVFIQIERLKPKKGLHWKKK